MKGYLILLLIFVLGSLLGNDFMQFDTGNFYGEFELSEICDSLKSTVTILKFNPAEVEFGLYCQTEYGPMKRDVKEWVTDFGLICGVNAGMYKKDYKTGNGYLKNYEHINNRSRTDDYNMFFVCNPLNDSLPQAQIVDIDEKDSELIISQYNSVLQSIRMFTADGKNVWGNYRKKWSSATLGEDRDGNVLLIYCCDAYNMHGLINQLLTLPIDLKKLMYLEGIVQSLYFNYKDVIIGRNGSTVVTDDSTRFFDNPNIIGVKQK